MHPKRMSSAGPLDVLVLAQGGVGSLLFSASRDACKPRHHGLLRNQPGAAAEGAQTIDQGHDLPPATHALLHGSPGLAGAHPKSTEELRVGTACVSTCSSRRSTAQ